MEALTITLKLNLRSTEVGEHTIERIGQLISGLPVYLFTYINSGIQTIGVMADEVEKLAPEALGPVVAGYNTVDYGKLYRKAA